MRCLILLLLILNFQHATAASPTLRVQVATDADVFASPGFKAKVVDHVVMGTVVIMKTEKFVGEGGMGIFYKIKTPSGKIGYITDSDLLSAGQPIPVANSSPETKPKTEARPALTGLTVGLIDYSEKINGQKWDHEHIFFGARRTSSAANPHSWRTDINLLLSPGAPKFLAAAGAYGQTKGFIILADFEFLKPLIASPRSMLYAGAAPLVGYTNYSTNLNNAPLTVSKFTVGVDVNAGFALAFSGGALHIDLKYYVEKTMYLGETVSLLMAY